MGSFIAHEAALREFSAYLLRRWLERTCTSCGHRFYRKATKADERCGSFDCEGGYAFLTAKPPRRDFLFPRRIADLFAAFFEARGYRRAAAIPVTGYAANHVFTSTAGQIFDDAIFRGQPYETVPYFVTQPVVRMQEATHDGFLKSFVNISLERLEASVTDHLRSFEDYLDFLSRVGAYVGDLRIKVFEDRPDWGTGEFRSAVIGVYHDGLEIGVLNYFTDLQRAGGGTVSMSDVSFGLERIAWSVNRTSRFVDVVGPAMELVRDAPHDLLDAYRTITLMLLCGVVPERRTQAGDKLRSLFLSSMSPLSPIRLDLIDDYYRWWSRFIEPLATYQLVVDRSCQQLARQLEDRLGVRSVRARTPEEVITELIANRVLNHRDLKGKLYER